MDEINPTWRIEREPASRVFLVLADAIRLDPKLREKVKAWLVPGRYSPELLPRLRDPEFAVTPNDCPAVSLWPEPRDGQERDNVSQAAALSVAVRVYLPGFDPLDALDYWGRIQRAITTDTLPDGTSLRVRLHEAGADGGPVRVDQPAVVRVADRGEPVQVAEGSFSVTYRITERA